MTGRDPRHLSWHTFPMVNEESARRLLDRKDDLAQVVLCLALIYRSFVRVVEASQRLATETGVEADELRGLLAYRIEHAGRWLERLEERLPSVWNEFAGAASRNPVRFQGIETTSSVVVAAKFARATLANAALVVGGESTRPVVELCGDTPPVLRRDRILSHVPALASWAIEHLATVPVQGLFTVIDIELVNAQRVRAGVAPLPRQVRKAHDSDGMLTKTTSRLLTAIRDLNLAGQRDVVHKDVVKATKLSGKTKLSGNTSRQYLAKLARLGLLTNHEDLGWVVTPAGLDQLERYQAKHRPS